MIDLSSVALFAGVSDNTLSALRRDAVLHQYQQGEALFDQGDGATNLVCILRGAVDILACGESLVSRGPGEILGEQAIIEDKPRTATARAMGTVDTVELPRATVARLLQEDPVLALNLLRVLSSKLAQASEDRAHRYRERRMLFCEFSAHVSRDLVEKLLAQGNAYGDPQHIDAVILFVDIRGFTSKSETMMPDQIAADLGPFFDAVVGLVHQHQGRVDKFIGDCVMAVWGFGNGSDDFGELALDCALAIARRASALTFGGQPLAIGIGLDRGQVFIGNIGSSAKRQFTVFGQPVNMAARCESATKELHVPIVMGKDFAEALPAARRDALSAHPTTSVKDLSGPVYSLNPLVDD